MNPQYFLNIIAVFKDWKVRRRRQRVFRDIMWLSENDSRELNPDMARWDPDKKEDQPWIEVHEIVVENQHSKDQLILASRYIHDMVELDTDYMAANYIAHLYEHPELIVVRPKVITEAAPNE